MTKLSATLSRWGYRAVDIAHVPYEAANWKRLPRGWRIAVLAAFPVTLPIWLVIVAAASIGALLLSIAAAACFFASDFLE